MRRDLYLCPCLSVCHSRRESAVAVALALAVALFLSFPKGICVRPSLALALAFLSVIPKGICVALALHWPLPFFLSFPKGICVRPSLALALAFLSVIPEGNLRLVLPRCYSPRTPPREYHFWVYILPSCSHTLYVGFTNNLRVRIAQHQEATPGTHTANYQIVRLVYYEFYKYVRSAIAREKELKHWTREQKIALIESVNPTWEDLIID